MVVVVVVVEGVAFRDLLSQTKSVGKSFYNFVMDFWKMFRVGFFFSWRQENEWQYV